MPLLPLVASHVVAVACHPQASPLFSLPPVLVPLAAVVACLRQVLASLAAVAVCHPQVLASPVAEVACLRQVLPVLLQVPPVLAGVFHAVVVASHLPVASRAVAVSRLWVVAVFRLWAVGVYHLWAVAVYHHYFSRSVRKWP